MWFKLWSVKEVPEIVSTNMSLSKPNTEFAHAEAQGYIFNFYVFFATVF
jgi:hypothetical protein